MRVLITSPRGKERLCKAFEAAGWTVVASLLELPHLIVPTVDEELPFFAQNKDWFESQGIQVMVSSPRTIDICRDKALFSKFCRDHEFIKPLTEPCGNKIVKPRFGKGSKGLIWLNDSYIIQNVIKFPEVSVDYFAAHAGIPDSIIPRFRVNVVNGESQEMVLVDGFDTKEIVRLGAELGLVGHNVIQGFWDAEGKTFCFGEVNPRFGGGSWMTFEIFNSPKRLMEFTKCAMRS